VETPPKEILRLQLERVCGRPVREHESVVRIERAYGGGEAFHQGLILAVARLERGLRVSLCGDVVARDQHTVAAPAYVRAHDGGEQEHPADRPASTPQPHLNALREISPEGPPETLERVRALVGYDQVKELLPCQLLRRVPETCRDGIVRVQYNAVRIHNGAEHWTVVIEGTVPALQGGQVLGKAVCLVVCLVSELVEAGDLAPERFQLRERLTRRPGSVSHDVVPLHRGAAGIQADAAVRAQDLIGRTAA
jgi:hypothetical protein